MKATLTNLTPSPFDIQTTVGRMAIAAHGTLEGDFEPGYLDLLESAGTITVDRSGGDLAAQYQELAGKPADRRWADERLQAEIDLLLAAPPAETE